MNSIRKAINGRSVAGLCIAAILACFLPSSCKKAQEPAAPPTTEPTQSDAPTGPQKYSLKGTVLAVDPTSKSANIDSEAIPGFMDAMAMNYNVHSDADLAKLKPKEKITADLIVTPNGGAYIENVNVVGATADAKPKTP
ncbi:MAG TPA: copper-binding protein [Candidatus Acidoferrales bacterium]|nr:copper-binding protein [Candidatus Acidoferrales bacterium]